MKNCSRNNLNYDATGESVKASFSLMKNRVNNPENFSALTLTTENFSGNFF
jgi:hypothetical protein